MPFPAKRSSLLVKISLIPYFSEYFNPYYLFQRRAKVPNYSEGRPSKFDKAKLMAGEGIIRIQSGSNKYATQAGMTGFGVPRDVIDKIHSPNIKVVRWD